MVTSASQQQQEGLEWKQQPGFVDYVKALAWMERRVQEIQVETGQECVWLLEHPPLYTLGTRGNEHDILNPKQLPFFKSGRGGQATYHGPGQRVVYVLLNLRNYHQDIKWYVQILEEWIIHTLAYFGVRGERREGRVGIWVQRDGQDLKIAAIGVRVQKWVTSHGFSLNVCPNLEAYQDIVPCGLTQYGVTSLEDLGISTSLEEVDLVLKQTCPF